jgi:hypothetical protein
MKTRVQVGARIGASALMSPGERRLTDEVVVGHADAVRVALPPTAPPSPDLCQQ